MICESGRNRRQNSRLIGRQFAWSPKYKQIVAITIPNIFGQEQFLERIQEPSSHFHQYRKYFRILQSKSCQIW